MARPISRKAWTTGFIAAWPPQTPSRRRFPSLRRLQRGEKVRERDSYPTESTLWTVGELALIISEVWPAEGKKQEYLYIAAKLGALLDQIEGFISIERFESLYESGKILSLSFFRDQAAVENWRTLEAQPHRTSYGTCKRVS